MVDLVGEPDDEEDIATDAAPSARSWRWLWIGLGAAAFLAVNVGLTLFLTQRGPDASPTAAQEAASQTPAPQPQPQPQPQQDAIFYPLDPAFVVNFKDEDAIRFLQVKVEVMTHDPAVVDALKRYSPIIRNNLLLLFSSQSYASLSTRSDKEKLLAATRAEIQKVLKAKTGHGGVDAVYFTSFVMQ